MLSASPSTYNKNPTTPPHLLSYAPGPSHHHLLPRLIQSPPPCTPSPSFKDLSLHTHSQRGPFKIYIRSCQSMASHYTLKKKIHILPQPIRPHNLILVNLPEFSFQQSSPYTSIIFSHTFILSIPARHIPSSGPLHGPFLLAGYSPQLCPVPAPSNSSGLSSNATSSKTTSSLHALTTFPSCIKSHLKEEKTEVKQSTPAPKGKTKIRTERGWDKKSNRVQVRKLTVWV